MNIGATYHDQLRPQGAGANPLENDSGGTPPEAVEAVRDEVRQITQGIAELARQVVSPETFFRQFLQQVSTALASVAGTIWSIDDARGVQRLAEFNGPAVAESDDARQALIRRVAGAGERMMLSPHSASVDLGVANPSDFLLLLVPLQLEGQVVAVIEVFQRPDRGAATQRGYLAYLLQVGDLAEQYLQRERLLSLRLEKDWSQQLEQFLARIHGRLGVEETAFTLVNEARRLLQVDRVSLALGTGRGCRIRVVSGLDNLDRRAAQVRQLTRLTSRAIRAREAIWLGPDQDELAPQIEQQWQSYVDISHVRQCAILPLFPPCADQSQASTSDSSAPFGAMIIEQLSEPLSDSGAPRAIRKHAAQLRLHASLALHNALEHENLFLLPVWRACGKISRAIGGEYFSHTLITILLIVAAVFGLVGTRADFTIPVRGELQPEMRATVFACEDGVITDIHVNDGQMVETGVVLAELRNTELEVEIMSLSGELMATREQILSLQRALLDDPRLDTAQQNQLNGELRQQQQLAENLERRLALLRQREEDLLVRTDRAGQVVTWHVRDKLLHRPVHKGQALMAIIDPDANWELELFVPVRHSGHILEALAEDTAPLRVAFILASHPDQPCEGTVKAIDPVAIEHEELGSAVRILVAVDGTRLPERKTNATVAAKIFCGRRSLGYAWFHDLIDTIHSRALFWL